jgi:hypothetical protein
MKKYFKKHFPQNDVILSNGARVKFSTNNGLVGYFATDNAFLQEEFVKCMAEQRYGISEIEEKEYKAEYLEKKTPPAEAQGGSWREEWGKGRNLASRSTPVSRLGAEAVAAAVAVADGVTDVPKSRGGAVMEDPKIAPAVPFKTGAATTSRESFKPPTGKRPKANQ